MSPLKWTDDFLYPFCGQVKVWPAINLQPLFFNTLCAFVYVKEVERVRDQYLAVNKFIFKVNQFFICTGIASADAEEDNQRRYSAPVVLGAMGCGKKLVWRCHQLLSGFIANVYLS